MTNLFSDIPSVNGCNLVGHETRMFRKSVHLARLDCKPKNRCFAGSVVNGADDNRQCPVEALVLRDDRRARFVEIACCPGDGPNFTTSHGRFFQSAVASTKS